MDSMEGPVQNAATIAAVVIPLGVVAAAVVVWHAVVPHAPRHTTSPLHRRLNTAVTAVPLSGAYIQQANHHPEEGPIHHSRLLHHLHPVDFVNSVYDPPPAYPVHHLDVLFDVVPHGNGNIGNPAGGPVDVVPLPPPYPADPDGNDQPL
ncbi:hypothetical protein FRC04_006460 [Tulasnella sp. 424]|nr:hypothetical protein FRC04_006460 [Tulasnella sp. 424]KAG8980505.1 hypothetical protein FRC05_006138 [Tulasnella sp. 425]